MCLGIVCYTRTVQQVLISRGGAIYESVQPDHRQLTEGAAGILRIHASQLLGDLP